MTASTDAKGNTTSYTYDSSDRISTVSQGGISVSYSYSYSYSNDQLSEITHNGFTYNFIYDAMGRSKKVGIGERVLVENMYYAETGLLRKAEYDNGDSRSYEYASDILFDKCYCPLSKGTTSPGYMKKYSFY